MIPANGNITEPDAKVDVLARTVPSGVFGDDVKITLALRPLKDSGDGVLPVSIWPQKIDQIVDRALGTAFEIAVIPSDANAKLLPPPKQSDRRIGAALWNRRSDASDACLLWDKLIPETNDGKGNWASLIKGLNTFDEAMKKGPPVSMVCMSGKEGDIALLTKMARAIEALYLALSNDPVAARATLSEIARSSAETALSSWTEYKELLAELDAKESDEQAIGTDIQVKGSDVTQIDTLAKKRKMAVAALDEARAACAVTQGEGAGTCGSEVIAEIAKKITEQLDTESCACSHLNGNIASIYKELLSLRKQFLLANAIGEIEFAELQRSVKARDSSDEESKQYKKPDEDLATEGKLKKPNLAAKRLFNLDETPDLGRLFRTFVDLKIDATELALELGGQDGEVFCFIRFASNELAVSQQNRCIWTLAKARINGGKVVQFLPTTREEVILRIAGVDSDEISRALTQSNGVFLLGARTKKGRPRFETVSIDVQSAAQDAGSRADRLMGLVGDTMRRSEADPTEEWNEAVDTEYIEPSCLRSGGLSVLNFACSSELSRQVGASRAACTQNSEARYVDATDLTVGRLPTYGLLHRDENDNDITTWHLLTARRIHYGQTKLAGIDDVDALIAPFYRPGERKFAQAAVDRSVPQAKLLGEGAQRSLIAKVSEAELSYLGDPMGIETGLSERDCPIDPEQDISMNREIDLLSAADEDVSESDLVAPLRFGQPGRLGFRAVYLGGGTLDAESARQAFLDTPNAALPPQDDPNVPVEGRRFLRSEAIAPVSVAIPKSEADEEIRRYRVDNPSDYLPQTSGTVILRSRVNDDATFDLIGSDTITRIVLPSFLNLEAAEQHGLFDEVGPYWFNVVNPRIESVSDLPPWRTAYHRRVTVDRPRDGLRDIHMDAGWGGAPILRHDLGAAADRNAIVSAAFDDGADWLKAMREWSRDLERWQKAGAPAGKQPPLPETPTGDTVFASRRTKTLRLGRTVPCYPDPMASELVIRLRKPETAVGEDGDVALCVAFVEVARYPEVQPIALRLKRETKLKAPEIEKSKTLALVEGVTCCEVILKIPAGSTYMLDLWCRPSVDALTGWSELVDTAATLRETGAFCETLGDIGELFGSCENNEQGEQNCGLLGQRAPSHAALTELAKQLYSALATRPIPELSRVRSIDVRHAITRPARVPIDVPALEQTSLNLRRVTEDLPDMMRALGPAVTDTIERLPSGWFASSDHQDANVITGGTEVDLGGYLELDLSSTSAFEILAEAIAIKGGAFDDTGRTRGIASIQRGEYPKSEKAESTQFQKTGEIYGFKIDRKGRPSFRSDVASWAQFTNLPKSVPMPDDKVGGRELVSLHSLFGREVEGNAPGDIDARITPLFADTRARHVKLQFRAISRFEADFTSRPTIAGSTFVPGEPLEDVLPLDGIKTVSVWLPASERPAKPVPAAEAHPKIAEVLSKEAKPFPHMTSKRVSRVRLWLKRPWFSSGEGEKLGIVIWPPMDRKAETVALGLKKTGRELFVRPSVADSPEPRREIDWMALDAFEERHMTGAGQFVSRWGSDPAEEFPSRGWRNWIIPKSVFADFLFPSTIEDTVARRPDATFVPNVAMPIPETKEADDEAQKETDDEKEEQGKYDAPEPRRQRYLNVDLLTYEPRFDIDREQWYVDVTLDPGPMIAPFIRLGVVRYQEHAPRDLQVSEPAEPYHFQLLTNREARAERLPPMPDQTGTTEWVPIPVKVTGPATFDLSFEAGERLDEKVFTQMHFQLIGRDRESGITKISAETSALPKQSHNGLAKWSTEFRLRKSVVDDAGLDFSILIEERAYRPPTTYDTENPEPRIASANSRRYMAKLPVPMLEDNRRHPTIQ